MSKEVSPFNCSVQELIIESVCSYCRQVYCDIIGTVCVRTVLLERGRLRTLPEWDVFGWQALMPRYNICTLGILHA